MISYQRATWLFLEGVSQYAPDGIEITPLIVDLGDIHFDCSIPLDGNGARMGRAMTVTMQLLEDEQEGVLSRKAMELGKKFAYTAISIAAGYKDYVELYDAGMAISMPLWPDKPKITLGGKYAVMHAQDTVLIR
jgi:hypothetical protein